MTSSIDWNRFLLSLQKKETEISNRNLYPHIQKTIESLAILQKSLLEQRLPHSVIRWMEHVNVEDTEKTCAELSYLVSQPHAAFKELDFSIRQRLTEMLIALEHILYHHLIRADKLVHANIYALKVLKERWHLSPEDEYIKSEIVAFHNKIKKWDDLSSLIPVLVESVHKVGCSYESQFSFEASCISKENSENIYQPEPIGVNDQGSEIMICDYCQSTVEKNRFGQREELLVCKDCGNKAHPSCLSYSTELVQQIRADDSWQCIDCKACVICDGTGDPDTLLFCDACDKGYHMQCHTPKLEQIPSGKWACSCCISKEKPDVSLPVVSPSPPPQHMPPKKVLVIDEEETLKLTTVIEPQKNGERMVVHHIPTHNIVTARSPPIIKNIDITVKTKSPPLLKLPLTTISPPSMLNPPPPGMTFGQVPVGATPVSLQEAPSHPIPLQLTTNQPHLIPLKHVLPEGVPLQPTPSQTVLGIGSRNNLNHILNPKTPLPDVRSSIREDVLCSLPPDVADWTVQDVNYYFKSHGYILESKLLEEQEIDGRAMLLMSRNDCLTGLRIKLGPALRIYHMHIHKLQIRTDFLG